jgi:hypothetical protein
MVFQVTVYSQAAMTYHYEKPRSLASLEKLTMLFKDFLKQLTKTRQND